MRRRVHIEFLGQTKVRITTFASQKDFDLDKLKSCNIDLVTLKTIKGTNNFYANLLTGNGTVNDPYYLNVRAHEEDNLMWGSLLATLNPMSNREETVEVTLKD